MGALSFTNTLTGNYITIGEYTPHDSYYIDIVPFSWRRLGTVVFECWSHGDRGFHSFLALVSYLGRVPTQTEYIIRNTTATLIQLTGLMASFLGLPGAIAGTVAGWAISIAGVA